MPLIALGIIGAIGSVAGGAIAASAAGKAADTQSQAAMSAAQLQKQSADEALAFQKQQYDTQQKNLAPWLSAGTTAINQLAGEKVPSFQAPTGANEQNDPGYQFRLSEGQKALENSASARGGLLSGGTAKAIAKYSQDYASNEYGNVYNRAMGEYNTNVLGPYNRLSALAGIGQQAQATGAAQGQAATGNITNILENSGQQQANTLQNAAAARASGYAAGGNIWGSTISGLSNIPLSYLAGKSGNNAFGVPPNTTYQAYNMGPGY